MNRDRVTVILFVATLAVTATAARADDAVRFDFETGDLQGWKVVDGQFDYVVSDRARFHNTYPDRAFDNNKYNKQGKYYLSTVEQQPGMPSNDRMTGVVESPVFVLAGPKMTMLVGSGTYPKAYVALCTLDGKEVLTARGKHHTEVMQPVAWNAPELVGRKVFLRVVDRETGGWGHVTFDDFTAAGRIDPEATQQQFAEVEARLARQRLEKRLAELNLSGLRAAIVDLMTTFPDRYPSGREYLARLDRIEEQLRRQLPETGREVPLKLVEEIDALHREALVANPLVGGRPILYVVRNQYKMGGHHAIDTLFHTGEINTHCFQGPGWLKSIDLATGRIETLLDVPEGIVRDPEVHFDGGRIVFSLRRRIEEDYHVWEIGADGTGLKQLTSAEGVCDFDPLYLPDDGIAFSSTREPKYNQCSRDIGANLFRMEADGANVHQIGKNNLFDNHGALTPDGRILYARWEYVDRNFGDAQGLWTVNPDGTNQAVYWGNNTASPAAAYYPRIVPGNPQQVLCIFGMHHYRMWGAMALVDRSRGIDGRGSVLRTWPADAIEKVRAGGGFDCDGYISVYPKYECPYPLSDKYFLCSRMTMRPGQQWTEGDARQGHEMGIYLLDVFGNELLLHVEEPGCYDPMPLGPRPRPPVIPARRDFASPEGSFYVADVYQGTHMNGVARGSVKQLRVVESPEKRHWSQGSWNGQGYTAPGMNWHSLENKRILGTVPVEPDGSAYFAVPAETFVYFQLLDEDGMMIQSMRSGASVQPGERAGCTGCHENRRTAPPVPGAATPLALRRPASRLADWYGPPRAFSFIDEVQPVFNRHCVSCHDYGKPAGAKLNLAPDRTIAFNTAYNEVWRKRYLRCVGAGPAEIQQAYSWGSHVSPLVEEILRPKVAEHNDLKLSREDLDRVITWVDLNAVYYPHYASAYPNSLTGRCPLDAAQLNRLSQLTGVPFGGTRSYSGNRGPQISFDRPELSPCLAKFQDTDKTDSSYVEALAIIRAGQQMLAERPRADMPGFQPCEVDQRREAKYAQRRQIELRNREAIRRGEKIYEEPK